jgi:pyridoxine 5-phosphate synthase
MRLGVNIDHVATLRNARNSAYPDILRAAQEAIKGGADGITAHLREDRRHIKDRDIEILAKQIDKPLNMEMAATEEMLKIALENKPHAVCIVPERREELTTEGGLDAVKGKAHLQRFVHAFNAAGIRTSLFIDASLEQLQAAASLKAPVVELHTGAYAEAYLSGDKARLSRELKLIQDAAAEAEKLGLECHAGHGLTYENVGAIAAIKTIKELNIGHFLIGEAVFVGLEKSTAEMKRRMELAK